MAPLLAAAIPIAIGLFSSALKGDDKKKDKKEVPKATPTPVSQQSYWQNNPYYTAGNQQNVSAYNPNFTYNPYGTAGQGMQQSQGMQSTQTKPYNPYDPGYE